MSLMRIQRALRPPRARSEPSRTLITDSLALQPGDLRRPLSDDITIRVRRLYLAARHETELGSFRIWMEKAGSAELNVLGRIVLYLAVLGKVRTSRTSEDRFSHLFVPKRRWFGTWSRFAPASRIC